jgi:hypothetical protein
MADVPNGLEEIGFCTLSIVRIFSRLNTQYTTFLRLDLSPSSDKKEKKEKRGKNPILLGPLERANLNHWPNLKDPTEWGFFPFLFPLFLFT